MKRSDRVVTEIDLRNRHKHIRYFYFPIDREGKNFDYRSRVAINAFFHSYKKQRNYKPSVKKADFLYHIQDTLQQKSTEEIHIELLGKNIYADVPRIECESVFEFFKLVNWDNKAKKWLDYEKHK